jgi:hypothetical protein
MKKSIMSPSWSTDTKKAEERLPALLLLDFDIKSPFRESERGKYWGKNIA